jgi:hypothetical protein
MPEPSSLSSSPPRSGRADATDTGSDGEWGRLYGAHYYMTDYTVPYGRNEHWITFFGELADRIVRDLGPRSTLDAGCAMGILVEQLAMRGVDAYGVDISEFAIAQVPEALRDKVWVGSLTDQLTRRYDLITCIEVLEHLPKPQSRRALANLCAATDRLLFSSVPDGYEEPTHMNVQPPEDWSAWFAEEGFVRSLEYDASYIAPWAILYERRRPSLPEIVRDYDRVFARLKKEVEQLRASVIDMHRKREASEESAPSDDLASAQKTASDLQEQLLAMRDTVVGLEAELGEALGAAEFYQALLRGKEAAAQEYERIVASKAFRTTAKALAPYRRVRRVFGR